MGGPAPALPIFDHLWGTFYNPPRRPPADIGIDGPMPAGFAGQLAQPFRNPARLAPAG